MKHHDVRGLNQCNVPGWSHPFDDPFSSRICFLPVVLQYSDKHYKMTGALHHLPCMEFLGAYVGIVLSTRRVLSTSEYAPGKICAGCPIKHLGDYLEKSVRKWEKKSDRKKFSLPCGYSLWWRGPGFGLASFVALIGRTSIPAFQLSSNKFFLSVVLLLVSSLVLLPISDAHRGYTFSCWNGCFPTLCFASSFSFQCFENQASDLSLPCCN